MKSNLTILLALLNDIQVSNRKNLNNLLASIQMVEKMIEEEELKE